MTGRNVPSTPSSKIERTPISTPGGSRVCQDKIVVTVRLRPLNKREQSTKDNVSWECIDDHSIVYKPLSNERVTQPASFTFGIYIYMLQFLIYINLFLIWIPCEIFTCSCR